MPPEIETISAGITVTRPSPMVRTVYVCSACCRSMPCCSTPIRNPGDDVDGRDQNARHRVALREAGGAVHRAIKFRFRRQVLAARARFGFVDQPGVQIRIDRHLFAGQRIQSESRGDFRNAHRAVVDDHVLNRDQHQENHRCRRCNCRPPRNCRMPESPVPPRAFRYCRCNRIKRDGGNVERQTE